MGPDDMFQLSQLDLFCLSGVEAKRSVLSQILGFCDGGSAYLHKVHNKSIFHLIMHLNVLLIGYLEV